MRRLCYLVAFVTVGSWLWGVSVCAYAASLSDEKAAAALLDEAVMMMDWRNHRRWRVAGVTDGSRAKKTFERVLKDYPTTKAAGAAECCLLDPLWRLGFLDNAIRAAKSSAAKHPNTAAAAWAQLRVGELLASAGPEELENAARELRNVAAMLPDRADLGPLNESRMVLGRLCEDYLANHADVVDAAEFLGLDKTDPKAKAETLATVAAFRGRLGKIEAVLPLLDRLARECPGESEEINWVRCRTAIAYLESSGCQGEFAPTPLKWLSDVPIRGGDDLAAEACLWQARYYSAHGPLSLAVSVLKDGRERYLDTAHGAEVVYGLGLLLERQGESAEAAAAMKDLIRLKPLAPFYPSLAEFFIGQQVALGNLTSVVSAMKDAEAHYSPARRFLAYRPADPFLAPGWMTAAQVVSLIKEEINEEALRIVSALPLSGGLTPAELLRARGEVLLCSMRSASTLSRLLHAQPDTVLPLVGPRLDPNDRERIAARCAVVDEAVDVLNRTDTSRCGTSDKRSWLAILADSYAQSGKPAAALELLRLALSVPSTPRPEQARLKHDMAMCYKQMKFMRSFYAVMEDLSKHYPDTSYGTEARRAAEGQRYLEEYLRESQTAGQKAESAGQRPH